MIGHDGFIPPFLLERLRASDDERLTGIATATLDVDERIRSGRAESSAPLRESGDWSIHTADNGATLPGKLVRGETDPPSGDSAVDEAATGLAATLDLVKNVFGRDSFDGSGATVVATVHYEKNYDNAFWNGTQLVFGDGDGVVFGRFTKPIDVLGHELMHAVTERTANLIYQGQSGALNESLSDCVGMCVKQRALGQTAEQADWLVGEGIFLPGVKGTALRSMKAPGTAYDDPRLGKDPQVGDMKDYVQTSEDNGGVHINSGIPNRAFYLAATAIGGDSATGAGLIWFRALTSGITADTDFARFAQATVAASPDSATADKVRTAWLTVGVTPGAGAASGAEPSGSTGSGELRVDRTGGVTGIRVTGTVDLAADDTRAREARALLDRVDLQAAGASPSRAPAPDRFTYRFCVPGQEPCDVPEQDLTADLASLAKLVLNPE